MSLAALLRSAAGLAALCIGAAAVFSLPADAGVLTILHTNDTHSFAAGLDKRGSPCDDDSACTGGYARLKAAVDAERAKNPDVLVLDAGDRWQGSLFFTLGGPDFIARMSAAIGWDAGTLGNHEFDLGEAELGRMLRREGFPILAANVLPGGPLDGMAGMMIRQIDGMKVGVFGLANSTECKLSDRCPLTRFLPTAEAARQAADALKRQGADVIVAITHECYLEDIALSREVPEIDVIVGGHSHSPLGAGIPESEGPYPTAAAHPDGSTTLILQAKRSTQYLGRTAVAFDQNGRAQAWRGDVIELSPDMPRDPGVENAVRAQARQIDALRRKVFARNDFDTVDGIDACRWGECLTGMLTADAMLDYGKRFGAVVAFLNGGAVRAALPVGPINRGSIEEIHPFGNTIAILDIQGSDLLAALENGVNDPDAEGPHLLQTAGLRCRVDARRPIGRRLVRAEVKQADGRWAPVDPKAVYRAATLDFLAKGGDGYSMLARSPRVSSDDALITDVFAAWLERQGAVKLPEPGRISGMPRDPHPTAKAGSC